MSEGRRACVIGAGLAGLALGIRLQAAGVATTVLDSRSNPGGRWRTWQREGFTFDAGPAAIDPAPLRALWALTGHDLAQDLELLPVASATRMSWPDGTTLDLSHDALKLRRDVTRIARGDVGGFEAFSGRLRELRQLAEGNGLLSKASGVLRLRAWRSLYDEAARFARDEKLREVLCADAVAAGVNPLRASAIWTANAHIEQPRALCWPRGGTGRLVAAMARHFQQLGGELRLGDGAAHIATAGGRCTEVETANGWRGAFHAVASDAGFAQTYGKLLGRADEKATGKSYSPAAFSVHFGIEGSWPGIAHHMVLFGRRFRRSLDDLDRHGVLPADLQIVLHHPSVTDPAVAPAGKSTFCATILVPHLGKLAADWQQLGPMLERRILEEVGRRLIPGIGDRLVTSFHITPRDAAADGAHLGSVGLEPSLRQIGPLRPANRDPQLRNLYLVGADTRPGPAAELASAERTASLMLRDLAA